MGEYKTTIKGCSCPARRYQPSVECKHMTQLRLDAYKQLGWLPPPADPTPAPTPKCGIVHKACTHAVKDRTQGCWGCDVKMCAACSWRECEEEAGKPLPEGYLLRCNVTFEDGGTCGQPRGSCAEHDKHTED